MMWLTVLHKINEQHAPAVAVDLGIVLVPFQPGALGTTAPACRSRLVSISPGPV